ncbi:uncharacterized protein LTR77_007088 [Saxophila tyrrhenica]|uniref:non-specific serine/threonine protein kinase n=1 Tax=Saxophila tyrrhenica TaxID=1690608 RepID=A0AAV9P6N7_9PEZI|nr:hypothetical protein LTR77_007088 [Saxophila tyrrhenica]
MSSSPPTPPRKAPSNETEWRFKPLSAPTEWIESYRPGGLHPIHLGDTLCGGRFKVVRKLGYGSSSTVWLAQDTHHNQLGQTGTRSGRRATSYGSVVAIKVMIADAPADSKESEMYKLISDTPADDQAKDHVLSLLDQCDHEGPNGTHRCMVFEPMGPSVGMLMDSEDGEGVQLAQAKSILKDTLLGLHCLHSCRIAHGDLNQGNLLTTLRPSHDQNPQALGQKPTPDNISDPVTRKDGKPDRWAPRYLCLDRPLTELVDANGAFRTKLTDLGAAFFFDDHPADPATPLGLRAPEHILHGPVDHSIDIWAFGCLVYEIFTGFQLFAISDFGSTETENNDSHLLEMTDVLGPLPPALYEKWDRRHRYFGPGGEAIRTGVGPDEPSKYPMAFIAPLEERFGEAKPEEMGKEETAQVLALIRRILQYDPALRPSTAELLEDEWFKNIGSGEGEESASSRSENDAAALDSTSVDSGVVSS